MKIAFPCKGLEEWWAHIDPHTGVWWVYKGGTRGINFVGSIRNGVAEYINTTSGVVYIRDGTLPPLVLLFASERRGTEAVCQTCPHQLTCLGESTSH